MHVNQLVQTGPDLLLQLGCAAAGPGVYWVVLAWVPGSNPAQFQIQNLGTVREAWRGSPYNMACGPGSNLSNNDILALNQDGGCSLGLLTGTWHQSQGRVFIILDGGSTFEGDTSLQTIHGTRNHFNQNVNFEAVPQTISQFLNLHPTFRTLQINKLCCALAFLHAATY